jgi:hypothetical protein
MRIISYGSTAKALDRFVERSHMCQSGNGFRNTGQRGCQPGEKRLMGMLLVKPWLRLAPNTYAALGCNRTTKTHGNHSDWRAGWKGGNACGLAVYCVSLKQAWKASGFYRWGNRVHRHAGPWNQSTICIPLLRKAWWRGPCSTSRAGQDGRIWWPFSVQKEEEEMQTKACKTMAESVCLYYNSGIVSWVSRAPMIC